MKKNLTLLALASLFTISTQNAFAEERDMGDRIMGIIEEVVIDKEPMKEEKPYVGECVDRESIPVAGHMCIKDKPRSGCDNSKGHYVHSRMNPDKCFSCKTGTVWMPEHFSCMPEKYN